MILHEDTEIFTNGSEEEILKKILTKRTFLYRIWTTNNGTNNEEGEPGELDRVDRRDQEQGKAASDLPDKLMEMDKEMELGHSAEKKGSVVMDRKR